MSPSPKGAKENAETPGTNIGRRSRGVAEQVSDQGTALSPAVRSDINRALAPVLSFETLLAIPSVTSPITAVMAHCASSLLVLKDYAGRVVGLDCEVDP